MLLLVFEYFSSNGNMFRNMSLDIADTRALLPSFGSARKFHPFRYVKIFCLSLSFE